MLKTILGITGVVFIGLGVFGGSLLGNITEKFSDQMAAVESPSTNVIVTENASATVALQNDGVDVAPATESVTVEVSESKTVVTPAANAVTTSPADEPASEPVIAETEETVIVAANAAGEVAEPMAPAQAAGDLVAMTEQAKSSSRNEQVNLAETILTSAKPPAQSESVTKTAEVETVMTATTGELSNEILVVVKDKVNLRDGPSIDHPIVLQLEQGQELMEFKREGKWVHVGAYGTSGKIGWVHQRLVSAAVN